MKESSYNFFYEFQKDPSKLIAYNSRTNSLALINKKDYAELKKYVENGVQIEDAKLLKELQKGEFLIEPDINELEILKFKMFASRYSSKGLGLTIAPTLDCNFACTYCYEKGKNEGYMSKEVQNNIIKFIEKQSKFIEQLSISWYGGEPLLAMEAIENITNKVLEIVKREKIKFSAMIVTNGYNLTKDTLLKLKKLNIKAMQVTIDGTGETHNSRRPLKNGGPTFERILSNLSENKKYLPSTNLRVNIDKENIKSLEEILEVIKEYNLEKTVATYPGYIEPTNDCYSVNNCLEVCDFSKVEYEFHERLQAVNFVPNIDYKYPYIKTNVCTADNLNSMVIDPKGDIYKCWSDVGRSEYKISNISENKMINLEKFFQYILYDPTIDEDCKDCEVLPLCMGGCPRRRVDNIVDRCTSYKYVLEGYIKNIALNKYRELNNEKVERR
ncbi:radical SAM protein [Proteinivorax tanatarense]|uniref:Radical SAM protein n=1 Tax=Proteinivorax tanatarense TaxID=1260629 RepID=A0AAU7VJW6_9FIRM